MPAPDWEQKMLCDIAPNRRTVPPESPRMRERLSEKEVNATIPKGNMGLINTLFLTL